MQPETRSAAVPAEALLSFRDSKYHIGFMHRTPVKCIPSDVVLAAVTHARFMHVDMLFVPPSGTEQDVDIMKQLFSAYMGESFCAYTPQKWTERDNSSHALLLLEVSEDEYYKARAYVCDLQVGKVPYNYVDLTLCALPNSMALTMAHDSPPYPLPKTVYCSQAAILMLRHAMSPSRKNAAIIGSLSRVNARACSPSMLYNILAPHCTLADVEAYVQFGVVASMC